MPKHDLVHKIEEAVHNIFLENNNKPLKVLEIVREVEKRLGNGEIDAKLTEQIVERMRDGFALLEMPDGKLTLNN